MCLSHRHTTLGTGLADGARMPFAEPGVEPHYAPDRAVRISHAHLELSLNPAEKSFSGRIRFEIAALPTYAGRFAFDVEDVTVDSVTDGEGNALLWSLEARQVKIRSEQAPDSVQIAFHGSDPSRGLYFPGPTPWAPERQPMAWTQCQDEDAHYIFPCHDHPGVKHPWSIHLDAPSGYTLLSNGRQVAVAQEGDRSTAHFEQAEPMPAYLFTAVAARLSVVEAQWRDRSVRYLVPVGREEAVARSMGKTPLMMEAFSQRLGVEYPWPRYDQVVVHDFIFGGMENVACTTMTELLLVSEDAILAWDPDGLVAHELAHQWFGDLVTCQDWSQGWLNESWATFMEAVWWEHDRSDAEATWYRFDTASGYFAEHSGRYRRPIVSYRFREPIDVFDRHLYNKGSCVLWTLRHELGTEAFWSGVQSYLERHRDQTVHTRHFQRAVEEATGRNLDRFFEQWVHSPGHPQLKVNLASSNGLLTVGVKQTQSGEGVPEAFAFTLRLEVVYDDGSTRVVDLPVSERDRAWAVPVDGEVHTVRVDPGFRVLAEIDVDAPVSWLQELLADRCPVVSWRAASALLSKDGAQALASVHDALSTHPHHDVRCKLAGGIARRGGNEALEVLCAALPGEQDPRVRTAICEALGRFPKSEAADALLADMARGEGTVQLRAAWLESLGRTRDNRAFEVLIEQTGARGWAWLVARKALAGLAFSREARAFDTLVSHTSANHHDRVRGAAAMGLAVLAEHVLEIRAKAVERLVEMLEEPGFTAQLMVLSALGRLRDPKALGALGQVHRTAPDGRTRRSAYEAMVRIREGKDPEQGLANLRARIEELAEANAKLRTRIARLEQVEE